MATKASPEQPEGGEPQKKKMLKQLTRKRDETELHYAARAGNLSDVESILFNTGEEELNLKGLLSKQNLSGETALYVASESGQVEIVREMMKYYDPEAAAIKARNGLDPFLNVAKQGDLEILKILMETDYSLSMTYDSSNTTALQMAATQGHTEVVNFLLESGCGLASISRSNGKTALHSAARNGHLGVVKALLEKDPGITVRIDKKAQTALHMAVKGQSVEIVEELLKADPSSVQLVDNKGNTPLHVAIKKISQSLISLDEINKAALNRDGETVLDTAEKARLPEIATMLKEHGFVSAEQLIPQSTMTSTAQELKQTVSDIKHEVHYQLEHSRQTGKRVQGIQKRLGKMQAEGLNNAINSTTVVAVLIATVAFAAIFSVPGQYVDDPENIPPGMSLGEAKIGDNIAFLIFFVFDAVSLFISLAVVVVQTSVVVTESKAKKKMMAIINKLMWVACVLISVAFLALSFVVVGENEMWLAIGVTVIGATIMLTTLGLMCYWVIQHHLEARYRKSVRKNSIDCQSKSFSFSAMSDSEIINHEKYKHMYAI